MADQFNNLVIFELANNHHGSIEHAKYIIAKLGEAAAQRKINAAIKLQYRDLDTIIHPDYVGRADVKHIPRFLSTRLSQDEFKYLAEFIRTSDLHAVCTPFDEISVKLCLEHDIEILKVASCSANDWPLLEQIASAGKPVIISTGGQQFSGIDNIYNFFTHRHCDFALLHCVSLYPPQNSQIQLNVIDKMRRRYPNISIGWSGHENPSDFLVTQMAIAKGATILERHVGHAADKISLNAYSTEVDNIELWLDAILMAQKICGDANEKIIEKSELISLKELARGSYCAKPILKGEIITPNKVFFAMPCQDGQTTSSEYLPTMIASKDYTPNEPLFEHRPLSDIVNMRSDIHDIKSMLYEANVVIPNNFDLELSHHYGIGRFREIGAAIINIVNRQYCKKIIAVLPNQKHPMHFHKAKEETFQVLNGILTLATGSNTFDISAGSIFTIMPGEKHAFTSEKGCIFEEISTTHIKDDSYYCDPLIAATDVMQRKTILKEW